MATVYRVRFYDGDGVCNLWFEKKSEANAARAQVRRMLRSHGLRSQEFPSISVDRVAVSGRRDLVALLNKAISRENG